MEPVGTGGEIEKESGRLDPERGIWAPLLWKCLHAFVELSGNGLIAIDEARELYWLLRHMEYVIPCARCRTHYIEYRAVNPPHKSGAFFAVKNVIQGWNKEGARRWLWEFHESVNTRLQKTVHVGLDDLPGIYGTVDIKVIWKQLWNEIFPEIGRLGGLEADKMREYNRHVLLWRGFAGL